MSCPNTDLQNPIWKTSSLTVGFGAYDNAIYIEATSFGPRQRLAPNFCQISVDRIHVHVDRKHNHVLFAGLLDT